MATSKQDLDTLLAALDANMTSNAAMLGVMCPNSATRAAALNDALSAPPSARLRTPAHRKLISARVDATGLPTYVLPWQHLIFRVLDTLQEPALPAEKSVINSLRSDLLKVTRMDPADSTTATASMEYARKFKSNFRLLVLNVATLANAIFVVSLENVERATPETAAQLLEAARYFLAAPGCVVLLSANEPELAAHLSQSSAANGEAILRGWMTGRVDLGPGAKAAASAASAASAAAPAPTKPISQSAAKPREEVLAAPKPQPLREPLIAPAAITRDPAPASAPPPAQRRVTRERAPLPALGPLAPALMAGVAVFVLDLLSKWLVGAVLPGAAITAVPVSFVNGSLTVALELAGIALTLLLAATGGRAQVGYGLIVGGLLASLWEQVTRGSLTNFIHLGGLPVFNLAHVALLAGIVVVAASLLRVEKSLVASR